MVLIAAAAQSMARIAILLVDQPLEDAVVAWVEWDEAIKVSVSDIRTVPLVLDFNQVNRLFAGRGLDGLLSWVVTNPKARPPYHQ